MVKDVGSKVGRELGLIFPLEDLKYWLGLVSGEPAQIRSENAGILTRSSDCFFYFLFFF